MKSLKLIIDFLLFIVFFGCNTVEPEYSDWGTEFIFKIESTKLTANAFGRELFFQSSTKNTYVFYDKKFGDTLRITFQGLMESINLIKDSVYQISYESQAGFPSSFGCIIKKNDMLLFQGITDWSLRNSISLIDSSELKVELSKEFKNEVALISDCKNRVIPVEFKFSEGYDSILLRQDQTKLLNGIKIILGVARKVEYNGDCLDDGMNGISFIAINNSIQ